MFEFLKPDKKGGGGADNTPAGEGDSAESEQKKDDQPQAAAPVNSSNREIQKLSVEIESIKTNLEAFKEIRKSFSERFNRISEQIGELRAMILDRDKTVQEVELKAMKAADLVSSVQPEKINTEVQKLDAKAEALKANLEGNESIMDRVMEELKEVKRQVQFFRGIEEIIKLSEETKRELIEIKKTESVINVNTDKISTLYSEIRKKYQDIDTMSSNLEELKALAELNHKEVEFLKGKTGELVSKGELDKLVVKVQRYIDALKEIKKESSMSKDIDKLKIMLESLK